MHGRCDYVACRTSEMDGILAWVEAQVEEIGDPSLNHGHQPTGHFASSLTEVSKQLWALLGPTLSKDSAMSAVFGNVPLASTSSTRRSSRR